MLYLIIVTVQAVIFGFATKIVIENKGYSENWFWWGFFFGLIALIVACAKPQNIDYSLHSSNTQSTHPSYTNYSSPYGSNLSRAADVAHNKQLLTSSGWKCTCGKVQAAYVYTCSCGRNKRDVLDAQRKEKQSGDQKQAETKKEATNMDESSKASAIKEYKELMDAGIISKEEFESKKT